MRKALIVTGLLLGAIIVVCLLLRLLWSFNDKKVLNVYLLDKTVTSFDRPEHKAFTWILNQNRYVLPNKKNYSNTKDYYGFFPIDLKEEIFDFKSLRINEVDAYAAVFDMAYYSDCYGVHSFEWYKGKLKPIRSQKVYGGLNQNDYLLMKKLIDNDKLFLGEYNMFNTPTNALVRSKTEALLGISWSNWSGKYFSTLNVDEIGGPPEWMKNLFESQHMGVWPINKSGIVLISNDGLIEILVEGDHLNSPIPTIITQDKMANRFAISERVLFEQWFEFMTPGDNNVISSFAIDANEKGEEVLTKIGLSSVTPAVIEQAGEKCFYYFCGDFAENPVKMWTSKVKGGGLINHLLYRFRAQNRAKFFKNYYTPLMNTILKEYHQKVSNEGNEKQDE